MPETQWNKAGAASLHLKAALVSWCAYMMHYLDLYIARWS